ncbi:MAG: DUF2157 domain-containing protein [Rhizobiales bacterium]|nr:DUF2157 domain-containing protein [Hyphomicrobiales bacterium]
MSERAYRERLEADLTRWQAEGLLPPKSADAIRATLRPVPEGITIATVVGIVGGLLIAAAFLAFIAANWTAIARPLRFAILLAGIVGAYGAGALFDRAERTHLADLSAGVGSIIFGAAIALVGQMYHLGDDFAGGLLLWASGALAAAALTGSHSALAVALAAGCAWSGMRIDETANVHPPFAIFSLIGAMLALAWNTAASRHLIAVAALAGAVLAGFGMVQGRIGSPNFTVVAIVSLMVGAGLLLTTRRGVAVRAFGLTLSTYGAFGLAIGLAGVIAEILRPVTPNLPYLSLGIAAVAIISAFAAAVAAQRAGPVLAALSITGALVVASGLIPTAAGEEPWLSYALALSAMLCLVVSGMLDDVRPRIVAGWLGLAATIAAVTWAVQGSLLRRAVFLAVAGLVAVALASLLGRMIGRGRR